MAAKLIRINILMNRINICSEKCSLLVCFLHKKCVLLFHLTHHKMEILSVLTATALGRLFWALSLLKCCSLWGEGFWRIYSMHMTVSTPCLSTAIKEIMEAKFNALPGLPDNYKEISGGTPPKRDGCSRKTMMH